MGELLRRFWLPVLTSEDLPHPDCDPVRVLLLGERLVAFRDTSGRVGLIDRLCAHRCADLFFGRNEEDGLRCTYHGWKFDVTGRCVDMPTEDEDSNFADKVTLTAYPCKEAGGVIWTYMGPSELEPSLPGLEFMNVPDSHRFVSWNIQENNFVQAIEGGIDSVHSQFLHSTLDSHKKNEAYYERARRTGALGDRYRAGDRHPKFFSRDTDWGVLIGARHNTPEDKYYWRYNIFLMPFYSAPPGGRSGKMFHAFVPLDDYTTARWCFTYNFNSPLPASEVAQLRKGQGVHAALIPGTHTPLRNKSNDYLIDREEQRTLTFTGITGTGEQDFSVQEGMGTVVDRSREHLGVTDIGIIAMRRRLMREANELQEGIEPFSASHPDVYMVRPGEVMLAADAQWDEDPAVKQEITATIK
jgi:phenylpropionate dioxygenase-like ring-hydroxylating dioxygenase large terminal subunit